MDINKLVEWKIKELNKYLTPSHQCLRLVEQKDEEDKIYYDLKWKREYFTDEYEEHVFGGDAWEISITLTGIEYGIRMQQFKL